MRMLRRADGVVYFWNEHLAKNPALTEFETDDPPVAPEPDTEYAARLERLAGQTGTPAVEPEAQPAVDPEPTHDVSGDESAPDQDTPNVRRRGRPPKEGSTWPSQI